MKRFLLILCAALALISFSGGKNAHAVSYDFTIYPNQMELNHNLAYTWGLDFSLGEDEIITGASFTLEGINNWKIEPDFLYVRLLDGVPAGIKSLNDNNGGTSLSTRQLFRQRSVPARITSLTNNKGGGDYFNGQGIHLFTYSDANEYKALKEKRGRLLPAKQLTGQQNLPAGIMPWKKNKWINPPENFTYAFGLSDLGYLTSYVSDGKFGFGLDPDSRYYFNAIKFYILTEVRKSPVIGGSQPVDSDPPVNGDDSPIIDLNPPVTDPDTPITYPDLPVIDPGLPITDTDTPVNGPDTPFNEPGLPVSIPEPGTLILLGAGLAGIAFFRRYNLKK